MAGKLRIGNAEIAGVLDMVPPPRDPTAFFRDIPLEDWAPYRENVLENGKLQLYYGCFFVRSSGKGILVDTGMGPGPHADRDNLTGDLLNQLQRQGVGPDDVDIVVHTHLHPDHVGWNLKQTDGTPSPYFPRATYLVPRLDWEYFTSPENLESAPYVRDNVMPLEKLGIMELIDGDHQITDEVTTLATPGHTPGHLTIMISSQGEKAMVVGDVLHSAVQVQEPEWCVWIDVDKDASRRSRHEVLRRAEHEGYLVAAGHFPPDHHIVRVVRLEGKRYWQGV